MISVFGLTPAKILKVSDNLPGAPKLLVELDALLQDPNSDLDSIASVLRRDMALTGKIIRIANGVIYSRGEPVNELEAALTRVGFAEAVRLVGIASMLQMTEVEFKYYPLSPKSLRENALFSALLMEALAPLAGIKPRMAYTAGLIRSIGRVVLDVAAQQERRIVEVPPLPPEGLVDWELSLFGMTNYDASYHVLKGWRFPADIIVAVRDQLLHKLAIDPLPIAKLLHVAVAASYAAGHSMQGGQYFIDRYSAKARDELDISDQQVAAAVSEVQRRFDQLKSVLA